MPDIVKSHNYEFIALTSFGNISQLFTPTKADAIGKEISNYNKVNTITFTANYVDSSGKKLVYLKQLI